MLKSGKVWGETSTLFQSDAIEIHQVTIEKGGYCSKHKHEHKFNMFNVLQGKLKITEWKDGLQDETILGKGDSCVAAPGNFHQFEALEKTVALEVYWVSFKPSDIIRESAGGSHV